MEPGSGRTPGSGWAAMRPVLVGFLLIADAIVVIALGLSRPTGWVPPFISFGTILAGLIVFEVWSLRHRRDDDAPPAGTD